jgi:hypothetical protein
MILDSVFEKLIHAIEGNISLLVVDVFVNVGSALSFLCWNYVTIVIFWKMYNLYHGKGEFTMFDGFHIAAMAVVAQFFISNPTNFKSLLLDPALDLMFSIPTLVTGRINDNGGVFSQIDAILNILFDKLKEVNLSKSSFISINMESLIMGAGMLVLVTVTFILKLRLFFTFCFSFILGGASFILLPVALILTSVDRNNGLLKNLLKSFLGNALIPFFASFIASIPLMILYRNTQKLNIQSGDIYNILFGIAQ